MAASAQKSIAGGACVVSFAASLDRGVPRHRRRKQPFIPIQTQPATDDGDSSGVQTMTWVDFQSIVLIAAFLSTIHSQLTRPCSARTLRIAIRSLVADFHFDTGSWKGFRQKL